MTSHFFTMNTKDQTFLILLLILSSLPRGERVQSPEEKTMKRARGLESKQRPAWNLYTSNILIEIKPATICGLCVYVTEHDRISLDVQTPCIMTAEENVESQKGKWKKKQQWTDASEGHRPPGEGTATKGSGMWKQTQALCMANLGLSSRSLWRRFGVLKFSAAEMSFLPLCVCVPDHTLFPCSRGFPVNFPRPSRYCLFSFHHNFFPWLFFEKKHVPLFLDAEWLCCLS